MVHESRTLPDEVVAALHRLRLAQVGERPQASVLPGGVSSDIWRVSLRSGTICVKRALAQLKVSADWRAPVARNAYEAAWIETAGTIVPTAVPRLLGHDRKANVIAMEYLQPEKYPLWKDKLRRGEADTGDARAVAGAIASIHAGTAGRNDVAKRFASDMIFHSIRLEPYLETASRVHPDLSVPLEEIVKRTAGTRLALVHGDVSPKNILIGPSGPVILDAECAWYGDPAFDLAFCLNHLLLKCLWTPAAASAFLQCFDALADTYLQGVTWEHRSALETRAAQLLAGLFLARIDGKSPVEYITNDADRNRVRRVARSLLQASTTRLGAVRAAWAEELEV